MKILLPLLLALTGCASDAYYQAHATSVLAWERAEVARAQARYTAIGEYAKHGNSHAQVLAVALLSNGRDSSPIPLPVAPEDSALRWASIIIPSLTNVAIAGYGARVAIAQSDNSRYMAEASYGALNQTSMSTRDVALAGFDTFRNMPPSSQSTTTSTISVGSNSHAAWDGGSMSFDSSRRCSGSWPNSSYGVYQGSAPFNC